MPTAERGARSDRRARRRMLGVALAVVALSAPAWSATPARAGSGEGVDRVLRDPRITESSGLVASTLHPGVVWTHNDSGHPPQLFAVAADGRTAATLTLGGAEARDWEALAPGRSGDGRPLLWVGDIGDNRSVRPYVRVYRVVEPERLADADVSWTELRLRYPDGPHDAEALLVDPRTQAMYVVTKAAVGAGVYAVPRTPAPAPAVNRLVRVAAAPPVVTDGAFAPDGSRLILVGYLGGQVFGSVGGHGTPVGLPLRPQGESVTWVGSDEVLVGSEGDQSRVWRVAVPAASSASSAPSAAAPRAPTAPTASTTARPAWLLPAGFAVLLLGLAVGVRFVVVRRDRRGIWLGHASQDAPKS